MNELAESWLRRKQWEHRSLAVEVSRVLLGDGDRPAGKGGGAASAAAVLALMGADPP